MAAVIDTSALTAFAHQAADLVEHLKKTGEPFVVTLNGKTQFEVRDLKSYYKLIEVLGQAEAIFAIRKGLEECSRRETVSAEVAFAEIREKYGISD